MFWEHCQREQWWETRSEKARGGAACRPSFNLGTLMEDTHKKGMVRVPERAETWLSPQLIQHCLTCKWINNYFLH